MNNTQIEEYKILSNRIAGIEKQYFQLLIFTITSFGAIFGVSESIDDPIIIPGILSIVLLLTNIQMMRLRKLQHEISVFLFKKYENESFSEYQTFYFKNNLKNIDSLNPIIKIYNILKEPFSLLAIISIVFSIYYVKNSINVLCINLSKSQWVVLVIIGLIHLYVFFRIFKWSLKFNTKYYIEKYNNFVTNNPL